MQRKFVAIQSKTSFETFMIVEVEYVSEETFNLAVQILEGMWKDCERNTTEGTVVGNMTKKLKEFGVSGIRPVSISSWIYV